MTSPVVSCAADGPAVAVFLNAVVHPWGSCWLEFLLWMLSVASLLLLAPCLVDGVPAVDGVSDVTNIPAEGMFCSYWLSCGNPAIDSLPVLARTLNNETF